MMESRTASFFEYVFHCPNKEAESAPLPDSDIDRDEEKAQSE